MKGYKIERKKCCCACSLRTGSLIIGIFQAFSAFGWVLAFVFIKYFLTSFEIKLYTEVLVVAILLVCLTFIIGVLLFVGAWKKHELMLRVTSYAEVFLVLSILIASIFFFFMEMWVTTFYGIFIMFAYFSFFNVIQSYADEIYHDRKSLEVTTNSLFRF